MYTGEVSEPEPETTPVVEDHVVPASVQSCEAGFALKDSRIAPLIPKLCILGPPAAPVIICVWNRKEGVASQSMAPKSTCKSVI